MADRTAWVFPGQGSQEAGMAAGLREASPAAAELLDRADATLGWPLSGLCVDGSEEELGRTDRAQPAIYTVSLALLAAARERGAVDAAPDFVAGHSLGEYTALAAAGALSFEDGLRLVARRGELTHAETQKQPGTMAAVLGLDDDAVRAVCHESGAEVCNYNAPGQVVIGGSKDAVARAVSLAQERGARRAMTLDVSGAFHSSLMRGAVEVFREAVRTTPIAPPRCPFVMNRGGEMTTDPAVIADELVAQLTSPVHWVACVQAMAGGGAGTFIEFGPGRVLTGLIKRIAAGATLKNVNGAAVAA